MARALPLSERPLTQPARTRLAPDHSRRTDILRAHEAAMTDGHAGYADPETGLFVLTAAWLASRGTCCDNGCRHCPYVVDESA
jgi:hypothetical protein